MQNSPRNIHANQIQGIISLRAAKSSSSSSMKVFSWRLTGHQHQ
jgi:hypothetical protein